MVRYFFAVIMAGFLAMVPPADAQQQEVWLQIEAQPTLVQAQRRARAYARGLPDLNGFRLTSGWYAMVLGPYLADEAEQVLRVYRAERVIPPDSFIVQGDQFRGRFWPVGETPPMSALPETTAEAAPEGRRDPIRETGVAPGALQETPREARQSEALLDRDGRVALQKALQWAGFYNGAIDAAFGRGTRGAMGQWQQANGFTATGVLTTRQRAQLLQRYNAVLDGLGLEPVRDTAAGIRIMMPTGVVAFDRLEPPFAHYTATGGIDASVLLISQRGDRSRLGGLYDIMQTLTIVPENGPRTLERDRFTLIGEGAQQVSHTQAWLRDGEIKGFTLIWPSGDEDRRIRLLAEMQDSFARLPGTLDPAAGGNAAQSIDLVAGLEVRKPMRTRSGFFVAPDGAVLTSADAVQGCGRITLDESYGARVAQTDPDLGVALLRPADPLAPPAVATFQQAVPRLQSRVAVAGYSYGGVLGGPTVTFGQLADLRGLDGQEHLQRLALSALQGDVGGPVVDAGGAVLGLLLPAPQTGRALPDGVSFAAKGAAIRGFLSSAGIRAAVASDRADLGAEAVTTRASRMTVLVSCWE